MRRLAAVGSITTLLALAPAWAQETAGQRAAEGAHDVTEGEEGGTIEVFAWLNFLLLTAGLVWIFRKNAVPYFASRALAVRKGMIEADEARAEAEKKMADVVARLAQLQTDIQALKDEAMREEQAQHERARQETAAALSKIRQHAEQEIESAGKAARLELRRYSAQLALGAAEETIRARMDGSTQDALFRGFVRNLHSASAQSN